VSEQDKPNKKADGSSMDAHLAKVAERNAAAQKAGRARRAEHERQQDERRTEIERRLGEALRKQS
jgi:hypothetical protein